MRKSSILLIVFSFLFLANQSFAQTANIKQGITVSPSIEHIDLAFDPPNYELTYTNNTSNEIYLTLSVQDFTELEDSYKIDFLQGKDAANYQYSLSSWITFENKNLQLSPGETKSVEIFIDKTGITKGGHYASILAEIQQPDVSKSINVKAVLASLLFVRASTGQEVEDGRISTFLPLRDVIQYPNGYILRFNNLGNVHVVPYGLVQVYDPSGKLVAKGIVNKDSLDALPESIRTYDINVTTFQKILLPGTYTAKIDLHFGKTNKHLSATVKFFSQGMFDFVKIGISLLILLIALIYLSRRLKHHKVS